jgi:hypothetical protein
MVHHSHLLNSLFLLFWCLLLADILEPESESQEERHCRQSGDEVEDPIDTLRVSDQDASDLAGIEQMAETKTG